MWESSRSHATSKRARKSCAGYSRRSSRSSHRRIGLRLPSALGARTTVDWCRPMIRSSPERCAASVWNVSRHYGTSLRRLRASHLWLSAAPIQIMLARPTLNEMLARRGQLEVVVVPDQGHAPLLAEPKVMRRVAAFVASCDVSVLVSVGPAPGQAVKLIGHDALPSSHDQASATPGKTGPTPLRLAFHVNKIPISAAIEGRGAQDMVALALRRRVGPVRASNLILRKQEVDMLISTKSGAPENERSKRICKSG